jgi:hypothetical protein
MRRLTLLLLLSALAAPSLALALRSGPGDGSLVVSNADGTITVQGQGVIFGHFDRGTLTVLDYKPDDTTAPSVSSAKMKLLTTKLNVVYSGSDVRFLFPGGKYTLKVEGAGVDISAVGKGKVQVVGTGLPDDGSLSVNGAKPVSVTLTGSASFGGASAATVDKATSIHVKTP